MEIMIYQLIHNFTEGIGGAETLVSQLFFNSKEQISNDSVSLNNLSEFQNSFSQSEFDPKFQIYVIGICNSVDETVGNRIGWGISNIYSIRAYWAVHRWMSRVESNCIVHSHLFPTAFYVGVAILLLRRKDIKHIFTEHSTNNKRRRNWLGKWIDRVMYAQIDRVICVSSGVERELVSTYPELKNRTIVIPNGIKLDDLSLPMIHEFSINLDSNLNSLIHQSDFLDNKGPMVMINSDLIILTIGRLVAAKNYGTALKVLFQLKQQGVEFQYVIAGSGAHAGSGNLEFELKKQVQNLDLVNQVLFLGHVEVPNELFRKAHLYLAISLFEGFGLAALEAMGHGIPVIYSSVPGLKELIPNEYPKELIVSPHSTEQILRALLFFEECSLSVRTELGLLCRKKAEEFSIDNTLQSHLLLYEELKL